RRARGTDRAGRIRPGGIRVLPVGYRSPSDRARGHRPPDIGGCVRDAPTIAAPPLFEDILSMNAAKKLPGRVVAAAIGLVTALAAHGAGTPEDSVAIVYQVSGTTTATVRGTEKPIILFVRLPAGAVILTGPESRVAVAFWNGGRCEVGPS